MEVAAKIEKIRLEKEALTLDCDSAVEETYSLHG
jgi:hypothetical protein